MTQRAVRWLAGLMLLVGPYPVVGQPTPSAETRRILSDSARVSLVTILPGDKVYSLFGHNAIRVVDPARGIDVAYNYGTFDFGSPLAFTARFAYGALDYRLSRQSYDRMVEYYPSEEGRPLIEQWLDLDADQREALFRFLEWNALPENAVYRYDFYYDNCATRVRDIFEDLLGEDLDAPLEDPDRTMRQLLDPYLVEKPLLHLGMDAAQGVAADAPASGRDELFLPDHLAEWIGGARLRGVDGYRPLVARTDSIGWTADRARLTPTPPWPAIAFSVFLVLVAWLTIADVRAGRTARRWLDVPLYAFLGLAGLFIAFAWFISLHEVGKRNVNILWAVPSHVWLAWVLARPKPRAGVEPYLWGTALLGVIFLAGIPLWTQEVPLALIPFVLAVSLRSAGLAVVRRRRTASAA